MSKIELIVVDDRTLPLVQHLRYRIYCAEKKFAMKGADHEARRLYERAFSLDPEAERVGAVRQFLEGHL